LLGLLQPDDLDEADLDAELDMLGDELEEEMTVGLQEESATPSYLLPSIPNAEPGKKVPVAADEYGLPEAPIGNR
jgi:charged multivesicular body protein 5